jgi:hypothetical protein
MTLAGLWSVRERGGGGGGEGGRGGRGGGVGFHSAKIVLCKAREWNGTEKQGELNYCPYI